MDSKYPSHPNLKHYGLVLLQEPPWGALRHASLSDRKMRVVDGATYAEYYAHDADALPELGAFLHLVGDLSQLTSGTMHHARVTGAAIREDEDVTFGYEDEDRSETGFVATHAARVERYLVPVEVTETWCPAWARELAR